MSLYDPTDWYWSVQDTNPSTHVYGSAGAAYVVLADVDYQAWVALGNTAQSIDSESNLIDVLNTAGFLTSAPTHASPHHVQYEINENWYLSCFDNGTICAAHAMVAGTIAYSEPNPPQAGQFLSNQTTYPAWGNVAKPLYQGFGFTGDVGWYAYDNSSSLQRVMEWDARGAVLKVGFLYIQNTSGVPGSPTAVTGASPMKFDPATAKLYIHDGSGWKSVTLS